MKDPLPRPLLRFLQRMSKARSRGEITQEESKARIAEGVIRVAQHPQAEPDSPAPLLTIPASAIRGLQALRRSTVEVPLKGLRGKKGGTAARPPMKRVGPKITRLARARTLLRTEQ